MNGNGENISEAFKTAYSELTDWICRERERAEPEIMLWFPAPVAEQMSALKRNGEVRGGGKYMCM